jgi:hypothetical protein
MLIITGRWIRIALRITGGQTQGNEVPDLPDLLKSESE